jgi:hypothetical protein
MEGILYITLNSEAVLTEIEAEQVMRHVLAIKPRPPAHALEVRRLPPLL